MVAWMKTDFTAERLRPAVDDLCWLLSRDYPPVASVKLVGDRHDLSRTQRIAVRRMSCSASQAQQRRGRQVNAPTALIQVNAPTALIIDGYNVLTTVQVALAGGVLLHCADGTVRDMAGMHGQWRGAADAAFEAIATTLKRLHIDTAHWLFDAPVKGSGALAAQARGRVGWTAEVVRDPDPLLIDETGVIATADAGILDACGAWFDLASAVVTALSPRPSPGSA
jgi:hypothetical protein